MAECPNTIEEFQELERLLPLCKLTLYNQAKARIKTGAAKSVSEAARQLAEETGRSVEGIRTALKRADATGSLNQLTGTAKHAPKPTPKHEIELEYEINGDDEVCGDIDEEESREAWTKRVRKEIIETAKQIKKEDTHNHRAQGTGENEWYTPLKYIDMAVQVMGGIDIDPASSQLANETINADMFYNSEDDGLIKEWSGRVWLNPPYAQPTINDFAEKMSCEWESGRVKSAIVLTHNYTDTKWFHTLAGVCDAVCFTRGRVAFVNPFGEKASPTQGQAFFYFGSNKQLFKDVFGEIGLVFLR